MQGRRRRQGDLDGALRERRQEGHFVGGQRHGPPQRRFGDRRGEVAFGARIVAELEARLADRETLQALYEAAPVGAAPVLAVIDRLQADLLLQLEGAQDRRVLDGAEGRIVDPSRAVIAKGLLQRRRPQQAADMVGAERRRAHRPGPSSRCTTASWMWAASTIWAIGTDSLAA